MVKYKILFNHTQNNKPYLAFDDDNDFWHLHELNACDAEYIIDEVFPNLEKIRNGELYWDPYRSSAYGPYDSFEFGFDATIIDFYKDKSVINYGYWEGKIEVPSEDIFKFMKEWRDELVKWRENKQKSGNTEIK